MSFRTANGLVMLALFCGCGPPSHNISTPPVPSVPDHLARIPPPAARSLYIQGHRCLAEARWEDALAAFEAARLLDPGSSAIRRGLALAAAGAGDSAASEAHRRAAEELEGAP